MQLARMVGDGVDGLGWLHLLSPFGLTALAAPFSADRIGPVLLLAAAAGLMLAVAPLLATRRDLGDGLLHRPGRWRSRLALLGSVTGFATRTTLRPLAGWTVGLGAYFLLIGSLTTSLTGFLEQNPMFTELATQAGFGGLDTTGGFAATLFALLPVPVGAFAAVRITALAHDETSRRLGLLLAAPLSRTRLLTAHAAVTTAAVAVLTVAAGTAMWAGTAAVDADLGLTDALAGAANTLPVSLLGLGFSLVGLGLSPRLVIALGVLPGTGGFLRQVIGQSVDAPRWILRISPFAHLAPVPAAAASTVSSTVMVTIALAAALIGVAAHRHRDLHIG
jgi:ABC-2 type transport system permease protein